MIRLSLPWPPSTNGLYASVRGRLILSKKGRQYHADVLAAVAESGFPKAPPGRLKVELDLYPPDRRRSDVANREKVLTDAMKDAGVLADDCLIDCYVITRHHVVKGGRADVTITAWEGEAS